MVNKEKTIDIKSGNWTRQKITRVINFLDSVTSSLQSQVSEEMAASLRCIVLGKAPFITNCDECADITARYSVLCAACAAKLAVMSPQRLILQLTENDKTVWAACSFSTVFIPKVFGKPNTIEYCEELLDDLNSEESIAGMMELLSSPQRKDGEYEQ